MTKALIIIKGASFNNKVSSANNNKLKHLASLLIDSDINVYILTDVEYYNPFDNDKMIVSGRYNNIHYFNAGLSIQPKSILAKLIFRLTFYINTISSINSIKSISDNVVILLDHNSLLFGLVIKLISLFNRSKFVFYIEEWFPVHKERTRRFRLNAIIFNYFCFWFSDGSVVISEYLKQKALHVKKSLMVYKLPALANYEPNSYSSADAVINTQDFNFLYCASLGYIKDIRKVIQAFSLASKAIGEDKIVLKLIVSGSRKEMDDFRDEMLRNAELKIVVLSELPEKELFMEYKKADTLIAPLDFDERSSARFSQKIAEYCSAAKPIITSSVGDIPHYFTDGISAFLMSEYSAHSLSGKMIQVFNNRSNLKNVGDAGYRVGLKYFACEANKEHFKTFITRMFESRS